MELHDRDAAEDRAAERIASAHLELVRAARVLRARVLRVRVLRAQRNSETLMSPAAETTTTMQRPIADSRLKT
jgi:hypothetical protein